MSAREVATDLLLAASVLGTWLGCLGYLRLGSALDRLHCVAFVNVVGLGPLAAMAFVAEGASNRAVKIVILLLVSLLAGGALAHAIGRALVLRGTGEGA